MSDRTGFRLMETMTAIEPRPGYTLRVTWADGFAGDVDVSEHIRSFAVAAPLLEPERFAGVRIGADGFTADFGGDLEIPGDMLRLRALEKAGRVMPVADFRDWRRRNGLSLTAAAEALGVTRRMVAYYESGVRPIPRTIMLACLGWEVLAKKAA